ncbi:MAG TPA: Smr/MutS family protein, partial [Longimicrobiales bacterium]|nr:Smr/MutS family protein [Longimicrobiales bacterium]
EAGALRLDLPVADLEVVDAGPPPAPERRRGGGWRGPSLDRVHAEVDLRGMRVEEIERELTRALDEAVLGDLGELRIIHGKGTGALRKRVAELLAADARVLEHRLGGPGEGGAGVTVARLA